MGANPLSISTTVTLSFKIFSDERIKRGRGPDSIEKPVVPPVNNTKKKEVECIDKTKLRDYISNQSACE